MVVLHRHLPFVMCYKSCTESLLEGGGVIDVRDFSYVSVYRPDVIGSERCPHHGRTCSLPHMNVTLVIYYPDVDNKY
jgi:hypothetical protein